MVYGVLENCAPTGQGVPGSAKVAVVDAVEAEVKVVVVDAVEAEVKVVVVESAREVCSPCHHGEAESCSRCRRFSVELRYFPGAWKQGPGRRSVWMGWTGRCVWKWWAGRGVRKGWAGRCVWKWWAGRCVRKGWAGRCVWKWWAPGHSSL